MPQRNHYQVSAVKWDRTVQIITVKTRDVILGM